MCDRPVFFLCIGLALINILRMQGGHLSRLISVQADICHRHFQGQSNAVHILELIDNFKTLVESVPLGKTLDRVFGFPSKGDRVKCDGFWRE